MQEFQRQLIETLLKELTNSKVTLIFGPRQSGKSFLMNQIANQVKGKFTYYDLEQPTDLRKFTGNDEDVQELLLNSGKTVFIDEFHYLKNAGKIFKGIYDLGKRNPKKQIKIFASGSSAIEMHKHIKESMAGRVHKYQLMPLSLEEYSSINLTKEDYFIYGGLPETYQYEGEERESYLNGILETYIQKDIKSLVKEENISSFNKLIYMLAANQGQVVSVSNLANDLSVSAQTVQSYLDTLEQTYTLYPLKSFSNKLSNELKKSRKYYLYDLGIRNALIKDFSKLNERNDLSCIMESYVYHYLLFIANKANTDIFFWRTSKGSEVDFVWKRNQKLIPIEVKNKYEVSNLTKGMETFMRYYPLTEKAIILFNKSNNFDDYQEINLRGRTLYLINIENAHLYLRDILQA
ncbi:MAG: ATP-binding protein [Candidatus Caenarcaniphilales bacterium]|nr:ATP-binding protein [Candidatus Caenarcaniphilales bacterium]